MATFTAWKFDTPEGAKHAASTLEQAEREQIVKVLDHAIVSWPVGEANPHASHGHDDTMRGAAWGSLWGVLFGALFAVPVLGLAVGATIGGLRHVHEKLGVTKEQIEAIRDQVTEGTSALFVVTDEGDLDRLGERFRGVHMTLLSSNLTDTERDELMETFG